MITIIAAIGLNNELGKDNDLIWHLPADLRRFKKVTSGHTIIMGRNTFESIGKPLPNRRSIIITRNISYKKEGCEVVHSLEDAIKLIKDQKNAFIIGGAQIYKEAIEKKLVDQLELQLSRETRALPTMKINPEINNIFDFTFDDFELLNYNPHPHIKGAVAI